MLVAGFANENGLDGATSFPAAVLGDPPLVELPPVFVAGAEDFTKAEKSTAGLGAGFDAPAFKKLNVVDLSSAAGLC